MTSNLKLDDFWPYQAAVLADLVAQHTVRILRVHSDLNLSQWRVMAAIGDVPGRTSAHVVSVTPMDKGIVSRAVASLTDRGLVTKTLDPLDKRRAALDLTSQGRAHYVEISNALSQAINGLTPSAPKNATLNADLKTYIGAMQSLLKIER